MYPRIETITEKKLIGLHIVMTMADNKISELWRSFMSRRKEIKNNLTSELISMQVYNPPLDLAHFNQHTRFEKWATVEVSGFSDIPSGMQTYIIPAGLYAVFLHKGAASTGAKTFNYIFGTWLPASGYHFDARPQFEILGEMYRNDDPDSEEEIWIPIMRTY